MAICPKCHSEGELCAECPNCHFHYVEAADLRKSHNDELLGDIVGGQYVPLALIGEGGMGKIYRAKNKFIDKTVALKVLKSEYMEDETLKDRFFREAQVVSALDHPNIVKLYTCAPDEKHNQLFMAMELLVGKSLFYIIEKSVPDLKTMMNFFCEISSALGEAHKHGIFHRDLKPENVFIVTDDNGEEHAKVLDFGFARLQGAAKKLTMAGVAFGTSHYMSPEQAMGVLDITAACDIYALGVMLFQVVSGNLPYNHDSPMEVMYDQVNKETPVCVPRPEYNPPKELIECIYKCMEKDPLKRYQDGNELHAALEEINKKIDLDDVMASSPTIISKTVLPPSQDKPAGKLPKTLIILIAVVVILALVVLGLFLTLNK